MITAETTSALLNTPFSMKDLRESLVSPFSKGKKHPARRIVSPVNRPFRPSIEPPKNDHPKHTRRWLIAVLGGAAAAAGAYSLDRIIANQPQEKEEVPDLGLRINEAKFWATVRGGDRFQVLPDATDKAKLLPWSQDIYIGKSSLLFRVGVNKPMADFLFDQAKLIKPSILTNIILAEDWGEGDKISGEGGATGILKDETEQEVVIHLKRVAWQSFKLADQQRLPVQVYYQGIISRLASSWIVHELGHAGAETKTLWRRGQPISLTQQEAVHPQVYAFQEQYEQLYDQAGKQGLATSALLIGIEPTVDLNQLRTMIFQEAKQQGFE